MPKTTGAPPARPCQTCQTLSSENGQSYSVEIYRSLYSTLFSRQRSQKFLIISRNVENNYEKLLLRSKLDNARTCQTLSFENGHTNSIEIYRSSLTTLFSTQRSKKILLETGNVQNNYEKLQLRSMHNHTQNLSNTVFRKRALRFE